MAKITTDNIQSIMDECFKKFTDHYKGPSTFTGDTFNDLVGFSFSIPSGMYPKKKICPDGHMNKLIHSVQLNPDLLNDRLFLTLQDAFNSLRFDGGDLRQFSKRIVLCISIAMGEDIYYLCTISSSGKLIFKERVNHKCIDMEMLSMRGPNPTKNRVISAAFDIVKYLRMS